MDSFLNCGNTANCAGCMACLDACPVTAIDIKYGDDGAAYPEINIDKCINCKKCQRVCPVCNNLDGLAFSQKAYALTLNDVMERNKSASGGAFEAISTALFSQHPDLLIAGAMWTNGTCVEHRLLPYADRAVFRKSKYVQSNCSGIYKTVESALKEGKYVLFSGTPCQVAACKQYLGRSYDNLFLVDIICHGVPGKEILDKYFADLEKRNSSEVVSASFREKKKDLYGEYHSDNFVVKLASGRSISGNKKTSNYLRVFHNGYLFRDSCYECKFANQNRNSDITIGDYWHIQSLHPEMVDYSGVSCLLINSSKGEQIVSALSDVALTETEVAFLLNHNGQLLHPSNKPKKRDAFVEAIKTQEFDTVVCDLLGKPQVAKDIISNLIPGKLKRKVRSKRKK